jgi:hypothetical protein
MRRLVFTLTLLCCAITMFAQSPQLEVFNPPTSGVSYTDLFSSILSKKHTGGTPIVNGISVYLNWGDVDNGCQNATCASETGTCLETYCNWTAIDTELLGYINGTSSNGLSANGQKLNLIIIIVPEGEFTNNNIPAYVFNPSTYSGSWCTGCSPSQPQDVVTCGFWTGDANVPTGGADGVWNVNSCHLTGTGLANTPACPGSDLSDTAGGYPVLYEAPIMSAYRIFVQRVLKHYSSQGSGNGPTIGKYLGYIRPGLAEGGENQPFCTTGTVSGHNYGIWPSPAGLSYDLLNSIDPDWYTTTVTYPCTPYTNCQGKDAYLEGYDSADGPGYVKTIFGEMQTDLASWNHYYSPNQVAIVDNTHTGPPGNTDTNYADVEATIFAAAGLSSGFGMESLSEWDVANAPNGCIDDWCKNFNTYYTDVGILYLQTTVPNSEPVYFVSSIASSSGSWVVTCTATCTNFSGTPKNGLEATQYVKISGNSGTTGTFDVTSVTSSTKFVIDSTLCGVNHNVCAAGTGGIAYTGDYLPDTIPFAVTNHANTFEIYFCDWEFAFSTNSASNGCPANSTTPYSTYSADYASVLTTP